MDSDIKILQIKKQMNSKHLVVIYEKGNNIREYDLSLGIEESKKKTGRMSETMKYLMGDESAEPDLHLVHNNPTSSAMFWGELRSKDQEKEEKEFIQNLSSKMEILEINIERTRMLILEYNIRTDNDMHNEFIKYIEEVVETGDI